MKIQINEIVLNKTKAYLVPCLKKYGEVFETKLNSVFKVGMGIGDLLLINNGIIYEQHIFILVDTRIATSHFNSFTNWVREQQDIFEEDYAYDDIANGRYHMVVVKLPESCYEQNDLFKKSQFSKMYNTEDLNNYFTNKPNERAVLIKDKHYRIKYTEKLNKIFGSTVKPDELIGELSFPIRIKEEMFNDHLV